MIGNSLKDSLGARAMEDFAAYYKWFVGLALGIVGFFVRDLHAQYKEHLKESDARHVRLAVVEANYVHTNRRLDEINDKLDELISRVP